MEHTMAIFSKIKKGKIFYISLQRCGTKSFSTCFKNNGYKVATWENTNAHDWVRKVFEGRYEEVINSKFFKNAQVFDDSPWYMVPFMKYLYQKLPQSKFVYFHRPAKDWFRSMISHSKGETLGVPKRHCEFYNRLEEYFHGIDHLENMPEEKLNLSNQEAHYIKQHRKHQLEIRNFFEHAPSERFFYGELYDEDKYKKLSNAFNLDLTYQHDVHIHRSKLKISD
jgi:hypothetical protein